MATVAAMIVLGAAGAIARKLGVAFPVPNELSDYLVLVATYVPLALAEHDRAHINVEFFSERLPGRARELLEVVVVAVCLAFSLLLCQQTADLALRSLSSGLLTTGHLRLPAYVPQFVLPVGLGLLSFMYAVRLLRALAQVIGWASERPGPRPSGGGIAGAGG